MSAPSDDRRWLDDAANVDKLIKVLYVLCAALLVADFLFAKHGHFAFEDWPEFNAVYGFAAFVLIVFVAIALRKVISRPEDYYEEQVEPEAEQPEDHLRG